MALIWNISYQTQVMVVVKNKVPVEGEKDWENPVDPSKSSDERDKEQLLRQYKEAKRRKDNLTETDDQKEQKH